ncbi:MAG: glycosyltransferase family A protein [Litorilinea sp.]
MFKPTHTPNNAYRQDYPALSLPQISVIIPVYNGAEYLPAAVASIWEQNYAPLDVIIVDDGSTDATAQVVASLACDPRRAALRYVYQANRGPSAARNRGIRLAQADFVTFLDADDYWLPATLHRHLRYLLAHPAVQGVQGMTHPFRTLAAAPNYPDPADANIPATPPVEWAPITWSPKLDSGLYRRTVFARVGLLNENLRYSEDLDWILRAREQGVTITQLPEVAIAYRRHAHNSTNDLARTERAKFAAIQASLQRRKRTAKPTT